VTPAHPTPPRLVLMCGLPGSGKTTLARRLAPALPAVRLCPDEWLADLHLDPFTHDTRHLLEERLWQHGQHLLGLGVSVIMENGFWSRGERDTYRLRARELGAAVELRHLHASIDELMRRIATRSGQGAVPLTVEQVSTYASWFEQPDAAEKALFDPPAYLVDN
jgi:predicted kinase